MLKFKIFCRYIIFSKFQHRGNLARVIGMNKKKKFRGERIIFNIKMDNRTDKLSLIKLALKQTLTENGGRSSIHELERKYFEKYGRINFQVRLSLDLFTYHALIIIFLVIKRSIFYGYCRRLSRNVSARWCLRIV